MIQIFKNHKWAIVLALVASIIIALPQLYLRADLKDDYQGVELLGMGDEVPWLSRVREAYDGYLAISNAYFKEGKSDPYIVQPLGSDIIALFGRVFSMDINNTMLFSRFLFSFLVFLLIYGFIFVFTRHKTTALAMSAFLFLGNAFFNRPALLNILSGLSPDPSLKYVNYTRPVNPLMTHFFFFGFLFFYWLFLDKKQKKYGFLSAIFLGLSFYDYFYTWTFLYAFLGVLGVIYIFQKKWSDLKNIVFIVAGAAVIALPYLYNFYQTVMWSNYLEIGGRIGLISSRSLTLGFLVPLSLLVVFLFFPRKNKGQYFFALALAITPFIVLNQQMITGQVMQSAKYHWYYNVPLAIIFLGIIFFNLVEKKIRSNIVIKALAILIVFGSIGGAIFIQQNSYAAHRENIREQQKYGPLMAWLNQNAQKDEVVFTNNDTAYFTVIYTPLNVFYHSSAKYTLAGTHERLLNAIFLYYRLDGVNNDNVERIFTEDRETIAIELYGIYIRTYTGKEDYLPDELLLELIQKYQESLTVSTGDFFKEMLSTYQVKYLVWDKKENPSWQLDEYLFIKKVAEVNDFAIYRF
ncbi:MAG: hypothetical protein ABIB55_01240 [Candidatus Nealsonbacteria bacterium]